MQGAGAELVSHCVDESVTEWASQSLRSKGKHNKPKKISLERYQRDFSTVFYNEYWESRDISSPLLAMIRVNVTKVSHLVDESVIKHVCQILNDRGSH